MIIFYAHIRNFCALSPFYQVQSKQQVVVDHILFVPSMNRTNFIIESLHLA
jgi:hypothetical protein